MSMPLPLPFEQEEPRSNPRKVTPRQLLDIRESEWRPRLESVSLISEASLSQRQLDQAARALGSVFSEQMDVYLRSGLSQWPACTAAVTVGIATSRYSSGTFWPPLWEITEVPAARQDSGQWGDDLLRSLEILGADTFPEMTQKYVGPILMHSGIPTYCLGDLFDLLLHRAAVAPGTDAHGLHQWAIAGRNRMKDLDIPAQRFLSTGGDYALETIERCMHLLDSLREDPDTSARETGLPERFQRPAMEALERAASRGALPQRTAAGSNRPRAMRPRLHLDPFAHGVHVVLPTVEDDDDLDVLWEVTTDDGTRTVRARHRWGAGTAERTVFALPRPTRAVSVAARGTQVRERLELIDPHDPLLVFDDSGALVGAGQALPPGPLWVLHPSAQPLARSESAEDLGEYDVPYGWEGWTLVRLRLRRDDWIRLGDRQEDARRVQGRERPRLELTDPVIGVTTAHGAPIHAQRPHVVLPEAEGAPAQWRVEVRSVEEGRVLTRLRAESGTRVRLFEEYGSPVVGAFTVHVRGPLGRGLTRQVTVAEGLAARHTPAVRVLEGQGLVRAETVLDPADGTEAEPAHLSFGPAETARQAVVRSGTSALPIVVEPPHLRLLVTGERGPQWRAEPLRIDSESVAETGDLLLRLPEGGARPGELCVVQGDEIVQRVRPGADLGPGTHRYPLGQIVETALARRHLKLVVGYGPIPVPVALVRPRRLADSAELREGAIEFDGFAGIEDVTAAVYVCGASWRPPVVLPVSTEGRAILPEALREAGELRVLLGIEDPWSISEHPRWPQPRDPNVLVCAAPGRPRGADADEERLCAAFAEGEGLDTLPVSHDNAVRLWRVLGTSEHLLRSGVPAERIEACAAALGRAPLPALLAHGGADLSAQESVWALITGGLAAAPVGQRVPAGRAAELWHRLPVAAALATSDLLPLIGSEPEEPEHAELLEQLEERCGPVAAALLRGEADPAAGSGRFDATTEFLARMPEDQVAAIWQAARVVPRALLDEDSRTQAALGLFTERNRSELYRLRQSASDIITATLHLVKRIPETYRLPALALLESRHAPEASRWRNLPAASLALAVAARLAARGVRSCASLARGQQQVWGDLARCAPDLVRIDIVLAELALAGAERAHFTKEPSR
ncbi:hypothetical protein [Nocardiopsis alba]|uniref:Uncharacterized protein n=1 Tax=Nocardiopsis alba (strain ATCC BAA-2165 / BE74) TaxID=1205910 RepID=J7LB85_NOCAA|nr:hypothetical protein [Nocardiopsis alba]AFR08044.1 hypothetical protein B005_4035 [Nocardiopsis alba ATCC BAA-2165]